MKSFNYTTVEGDRIDLLAFRFYGSLDGIKILADANPSVPLDAVYPLGTRLIVPIIKDENKKSNAQLPPWKR